MAAGGGTVVPQYRSSIRTRRLRLGLTAERKPCAPGTERFPFQLKIGGNYIRRSVQFGIKVVKIILRLPCTCRSIREDFSSRLRHICVESASLIAVKADNRGLRAESRRPDFMVRPDPLRDRTASGGDLPGEARSNASGASFQANRRGFPAIASRSPIGWPIDKRSQLM